MHPHARTSQSRPIRGRENGANTCSKITATAVLAAAITAVGTGLATAEDPLGPNPHGPYNTPAECEQHRNATVAAGPTGVVGPYMSGDRLDSSYDPNKLYYHIMWH